MSNVKHILLCAGINFRKWRGNPRIYTVLAVSLVFLSFAFSGLPDFCAYYKTSATPWVFPFYMGNPSLFLIFGGLAMLLYCDAPFVDGQTPFLIIRAGRRNWILGQLLYILSSALVYTLCNVLFSILVILPNITFSPDWGRVLWTLAENSTIALSEQTGIALGFQPSVQLMEMYSPMELMAAAILLYWLGTAFVGVLVFCFNIMTGKMFGLVMGGIFTSMGYFVCYLGWISLGPWIYYLSPVTWSSILQLDWYGMGGVPTPGFAVTAYLLILVLMSVVSVVAFCRRDVEYQKGAV